jgi:hypothetical protein
MKVLRVDPAPVSVARLRKNEAGGADVQDGVLGFVTSAGDFARARDQERSGLRRVRRVCVIDPVLMGVRQGQGRPSRGNRQRTNQAGS